MQTTPRKLAFFQEEKYSQRFIPNRASSNLLGDFGKVTKDTLDNGVEMDSYHSLLEKQFEKTLSQEKILKFSPSLGKENISSGFGSFELSAPFGKIRKVSKSPYKILDAPNLMDDFYLNLVDWSSANQLIVGLGSCVYIWNALTCKVTKLTDLGLNNSVASVSTCQDGNLLVVGSNNGFINLWDLSRQKVIRPLSGHTMRVGALAWNGSIVSSGSRDRFIYNRDIRAREDVIASLSSHKQEVCGLKWSFDQQQLSSGGNDNRLILWNLHSNQPVYSFSAHCAAVKAMAWSPHQHGLLASGGGTADKTIRFWNTLNGEQLHCIDSGSQVCSLVFSKNTEEVVSSHGYMMNQIIIWNKNKKVASLTGHTMRVLYLAISPDGQNIVTGAGDETLRFWNVFPGAGCESDRRNSLLLSPFDMR
jgi:cell division cycle 20-like protein 1 (cofactor of APC complex)